MHAKKRPSGENRPGGEPNPEATLARKRSSESRTLSMITSFLEVIKDAWKEIGEKENVKD